MTDTICTSSDEEEILTYKLKIHDADISDSGKWKCEVQHKYGSVSATCDLSVFENAKRQSLTTSTAKSTVNGSSSSIQNGTAVQGTGSDSEEEILTYRLKIHDADLHDAGRWKCEVKDKYGTASATCDLDVFEPKLQEEAPRFLMVLRDVTTLEGQSVKLICRVKGNPLPKVVWYKDDEPISKDDYNYQVLYLKDGTISLEIFYPKPDKDAAVYKCEAENEKGTVFSEAKVTVVAKKREASLPRDHYLNLSKWTRARSESRAGSVDRSTARASSESRYTTSSSLTSSAKRIADYYTSSRSRRYSGGQDDVDSSYEIYRPGYNSLNFLRAGSMEPELKLKVKWGSDTEFYFQENLKSKCILEGSRCLMSCYVIGRLPLFVQWYKDGKPLLNNVYEKYAIRARAGHLSLEIPVTDLDDTGDYLVDVRNEQGRMNSSCYLQIEPRFKKYSDYEQPSFIQGIHHIHVNEGQTATFQVQVKGNPKPGVKWFKDGKRIQVTSKTTIHTGQKGVSILMVHDCEFSDQGLYRVEAHNMYGRCSGSAKLSVFESGTKFVCGDEGNFKIIRRNRNDEDEEVTETILARSNYKKHHLENEEDVVMQSKYQYSYEGESTSKSNGLDEVDIRSKRKGMVLNGDEYDSKEPFADRLMSSLTEKLTALSTKISSVNDEAVTGRERSRSAMRELSQGRTAENLETKSKVETVSSSRSRDMLQSEQVENADVSTKQLKMSEKEDIQEKATLKTAEHMLEATASGVSAIDTKKSASTVDSIDSKKVASKNASMEVESTEALVAKTSSSNVITEKAEVKTEQSEIEMTEKKENELSEMKTEKVEEIKSLSKAEEQKIVSESAKSELKRVASLEAIEKARRLSKGEVKLEKLYSPTDKLSRRSSIEDGSGEQPKRRLSKGFSIESDQGSSETPRRKLSRGLSFEKDQANGQNGRRSSKGFSIEADQNGRRLSKGLSIEGDQNGSQNGRRLSKGLSLDGNDQNGRKLSKGPPNEEQVADKYRKLSSGLPPVEKMDENVIDKNTINDAKLEKKNKDNKDETESSVQSKDSVKETTTETVLESAEASKTEINTKQKADEVSEKSKAIKADSEALSESLTKSYVDGTKLSVKSEEKEKIQTSTKSEEKTSVKTEKKSSADEIQKSTKSEERSSVDETQVSTILEEKSSTQMNEIQSLASKVVESAMQSAISSSSETQPSASKPEEKVYNQIALGDTDSSVKSTSATIETDLSLKANVDKIETCKTEDQLEQKNKLNESKKDANESEEIIAKKSSSSELEKSSIKTEEVSAIDAKKQESASSVSKAKALEQVEIEDVASTQSNVSEKTSPTSSKDKSADDTSKVKVNENIEIEEKSLMRSSKMVSQGSEIEIETEETNAVEEKETIYTTKPNVVKYLPKVVEIKDGEPLNLECLVAGEPRPKVVWLQNGKKISADFDHIFITSKAEYHNLEIKVSDFERDSGIYTLCATNISGEQKSSCEVKIDGSLKKLARLEQAKKDLEKKQILDFEKENSELTSEIESVLNSSEEQSLKTKKESKVESVKSDSSIEQSVNSQKDFEAKSVAIDSSVDKKNKTDNLDTLDSSFELTSELRTLTDKSKLQATSSISSEESKSISVVSKLDSKAESSLLADSKLTASSTVSIDESINQLKTRKDSYTADIAVSEKKLTEYSLSQEGRLLASGSVTVDEKTDFAAFEKLEAAKEQSLESTMVEKRSILSSKTSEAKSERMVGISSVSNNNQMSTCITSSSQIETMTGDLTGKAHFAVPLKPEYCPMERDENVRLYVKVAGEPLGPAKWYKDGEELEPNSRVLICWDMETQESTVVIRRYKLKDAGDYECVLMTDKGKLVTKTHLNLKRLETQRVETVLPHETPDLYVPLILYPIKEMTVYKGQEAYLECAVDKQPTGSLTVKWYRDGKEVRQRKRKFLLKENKGVYSLTIEDVQDEDCGSYTIEVSNGVKTETSSANVIMKVEKNKKLEVGPPTITEEPPSIIGVVEGGTIVMKCCAEANPPPVFRWQKDMVDICQSPRVVVSVAEAGQSTLTINDAQYSDRGLYLCVVKNRLGRKKVRINLHVGDEFKITEKVKSKRESVTAEREVKVEEESIPKKSTLELLSEKLENIEIVKTQESSGSSKISISADSVDSKTEIKSEFEPVGLNEEEKTKLAAEVAEKDRIKAERAIFLALMEARKYRIEAEEKAKIAEEKARIAREAAEKYRVEAEKAAFLAAEEAVLAKKIAEEKAELAEEIARKDRIAAEKAYLLMKLEEEKMQLAMTKQTVSLESKSQFNADEIEIERIEAEITSASLQSGITTNRSEKTSVKITQDTSASVQAAMTVEQVDQKSSEENIKATNETEEAKRTKKKHRLTFEEAEQLRLEEEAAQSKMESETSLNETEISADSEKSRTATEEVEKERMAALQAEKVRIATEEAEKAKLAAQLEEKSRLAVEEAEKARIVAEEAEKAIIAAEEAEKARLAAEVEQDKPKKIKHRLTFEEAEKLRLEEEAAADASVSSGSKVNVEQEKIATSEAELVRIAAEKAEQERISALEAEKARIAAEEDERARMAAEKAEQERISALEAEKARIAAEEDERAKLAAERAEQERIAALEAEKARIAAEEAEKAKLAAERAEQERIAALGAEKARVAAEEAEKARIAAEKAEQERIAALEADKARIAAEKAEQERIAALEAEKAKIAAEEAEKARVAAEKAEQERIAALEAEKARIAAEEAERARLAAEETEKARLAAEAEQNKPRKKKQRLTFEEAEKLRLQEEAATEASGSNESVEQEKIATLEAEKARIAALEAEKARTDEQSEATSVTEEKSAVVESTSIEQEQSETKATKKKHRLTFEEAERLRLEAETSDQLMGSGQSNSNNIPSEDSQALLTGKESSVQVEGQVMSLTSEREELDGAVMSKISSSSVKKAESTRSVMEATASASASEQMQCSVTQIDSTQQELANQIRHQLQKQLSAGGSKCEILEVSAQHVTRATGETTVVGQSIAHHHVHHPPEIIIGPDSRRVEAHSELEIIVRARASKHAKVKWVHDGKTVSFKGQQHYELVTEEEPVSE